MKRAVYLNHSLTEEQIATEKQWIESNSPYEEIEYLIYPSKTAALWLDNSIAVQSRLRQLDRKDLIRALPGQDIVHALYSEKEAYLQELERLDALMKGES